MLFLIPSLLVRVPISIQNVGGGYSWMQQTLCTSADCTSVVLRPPVRPNPVHWFNIYWLRCGLFGSSGSHSKPLKVLESEGR